MEFKKYPSIEQFRHLKDKLLNYYKHLHSMLNFSGTVKLHGTHADICFNGENFIQIQSRNRILSETEDNLGCFKFLKTREEDILDLINLILEKHPDCKFIMISGEFCGKGIQGGVGIGKVDPFFVIFDIYIDARWQSMENFKEIFKNDKRIFNIMQFELFNFQLNRDLLDNNEYIEEITKNLQIVAEKVGSECPIAKYFNISGEGEGVVYKCIEAPGISDLWFKSKCQKHSVRHEKIIKEPKINNEDGLEFVTEARLSQGIDYLREFNLQIDKTSLGIFIKWVVEDIFKEESDLDKSTSKLISNRCREWFLEYIKQNVCLK